MVYGFVNTSLSNEDEQLSLLRAYAKKHKLGDLRLIRAGDISELTGHRFKPGDVLLVDNITTIGSSLQQIRSVLQSFSQSRITFTSVVESYSFGSEINFEFAIKALDFVIKLRKNMVSCKTSRALKTVKSDGKILGRPKGRKNSVYKLSGQEKQICELLAAGHSKFDIAKKMGVARATLYGFLRNINKDRIPGRLEDLKI